ncbi:ABC transporter A family protein [Cavenderia fasciculata]|uniref:ABC transporter A family protein n=1 Tax=Cavenderia fasciculata TaxID=261658 RepID=F4QDS5_CACFS|nr:ABC transporter A family protein [Cavenderia fasciculata]EGG13872.1 ABC transporter A family protein [Cavenderia fasciculata]|eukprot:XP_004350580.1 ABC transporter A family protein [Cavenderia fasciculata]
MSNPSNQFRATFLKSATFLKRQKCALCLQIAIPLVLVAILSVIQIFIRHQIDQIESTLIPPVLVDVVVPGYFVDANPNGLNGIGSLSESGGGSGLLGNMPQFGIPIPSNNTNNGTTNSGSVSSGSGSSNSSSSSSSGEQDIYLPYAVGYDSEESMMSAISEIKTKLASERRSSFKIKDRFIMPFSSILFNDYNPTFSQSQTPVINYQMAVDTQPLFQWFNVSDPALYIFTMNLIQTAFCMSKQTTIINIDFFIKTVYGADFIIDSNLSEFPYLQQQPKIDVGSLLGGLFYPFALSFLLPLFVYSIVLEKQEKLRDMCLMAGLKMRNYWIVTYLFNLMLYTIAVIVVVGISVIFKFSVFTQGSPFAMALLLFGWGNAMITFSFFLSTIFKTTRVATVTCYFLVIIGVIVNIVLGVQFFENSAPPAPYYWYPPFAFNRGMALVSTLCGIEQCPNWSTYDWSFEPSRIIMWLYIDTVFYLLLALYLDQVLPREFGVPKKPTFIFDPIINLVRSLAGKTPTTQDDDDQTYLINDPKNKNKLNLDGDEVEEEPEDNDVAEERQRVESHQFSNNTPIVIQGLTKQYDGRPKPALDNLTIAVNNNECLGLLGPNGAGKSTTISILTGLYRASKGSAKVGGFDIATDMDNVHRIVGVCPQFDILWEDLSCVETLLFYARLKGVPIADEISHVEKTLADVDLLPVKDRLVKELSGGMKRRLSLSIALVGYSRVVFLDEVTNGLDVVTRKALWQTLKNITTNRCIILTSHMMDEVDVLSTRIAIMSQGKLKALGSPQHLKSKFGEGYSLKICIDDNHVDQVDAVSFVQQFSPSATLSERFIGNYTFRLPKNTIVSQLFSYILENKQKYHITHWGVNQSTLEDVFLKLSENDETVN